MTATAQLESNVVSSEELQEVLKYYDQGLYLQAYEIAQRSGPLHQWAGTDARIVAARLAGNLGGMRLADWLVLRAWRQDREHAEACWHYANYLLRSDGPWRTLCFMKGRDELPDASDEIQSYWQSLHATAYGRLRDFDSAEKWLARAAERGSQYPWVHLERATLRSFEDRHDEALAAARHALEVRPWYRPAVQWLAHFLVQKEHDDEAIDLLTEAARRIESCAVLAQLAGLQMELERFAEARVTLEECARLAPLIDKPMAQWLAANRCDVAYHCGDLEKSLEYARLVKAKFFEAQVKHLENPAHERRRVVLPVGFVRQHHQTCAPATLASLCRFWSMPGEHLELAETITYNGTPNHRERQWAQDNGWHTREFTVTWESAVALLDAGIPFTLTTHEVSSAHLQAVIGYDTLRGSLFIRDPGERHRPEFLATGLAEYAATGPRGLALVPLAERGRLDALALPDTEMFDRLFQLERALDAHDRDRAEQAYQEMIAADAQHRLTLVAERALAAYDADPARVLVATEKLLARFPDDLYFQLSKVNCLTQLARRDEYLQLLKKVSEQEKTDPACWQRYAGELAEDARAHPTALRWLRRALRVNPMDARGYSCQARILWEQRRFEEATELYRLAACLEDKDEHLAESYFMAAKSQGRTEEALQFLARRFERFGKKSSQPARTLAWAHFQLERSQDGFAILDQALALRPDDGDLILHAVRERVHHGNFSRARELLRKAKNVSQRGLWVRAVAEWTVARGDLESGRKLWAKVLTLEPLADDAHRAYARLLEETKGRAAALAHLQATCARNPWNFLLNQLLLDWLQDDGPDAVEPVVQRLIEINPANAWARRELALVRADQGRLDEAFAELAKAQPLEPNSVNYYTVRARLHELSGQIDDAKNCCREALRLSVDMDNAIHGWLGMCDTAAERREALEFIEQELVRQVISGGGLLTFRDVAMNVLDADELLVSLRGSLKARPDLWHAWSAVARQLRDMGMLDEAREVAQQAVERFSLLPAVWVDLAEIEKARGDDDAAADALLSALRINPGWSLPLRLLCELYQRRGRADQARALLEKAVARSPLDPANQLTLATLLWFEGERDAALARIRRVVEIDPGYESAWDLFCDWAADMGRFEDVVAHARELTRKRPGETRSWMRLAQALLRMPRTTELDHAQQTDECLQALARAQQLNPRLEDAYDLQAQMLCEADRLDEAVAACRNPVWGNRSPITLRGRLAYIIALRGKLEDAIAEMQRVLKDDHTYYWGWSKLAEWHKAMGKNEDYLKAAEQLVRLSPRGPQALAYRGEARLLLGKRKRGKADLRAVVELAPDYIFAGIKLFDEQLADKQFKQARATLLAMHRVVKEDAVKARIVQWFAVRSKRKPAARGFVQLCRSTTLDPWPLETAAAALDRAGWQSLAEKAYRKVAREERWNPHLAILWAERFDADFSDDLDDRLAALDRALPLVDNKFRALDLKAELLSKVGRFDEALEVCRTELADTEIPRRGRAAWIEFQRGRQHEALAQMRAVVDDDPTYYWGWSQLADWREQLGPPREYLEAAKRMVELAPDNPVSFVHRGQARVRLGKEAAAKEDFQQAVAIAPDFIFAALRLFELHLADNDIKAARAVLQNNIKPYGGPAEFALGSIRLACAAGKHRAALKHLGDLCAAEGTDPDQLAQAVKTLESAGLEADVENVLVEHLGVGRVVCEQWVALVMRQGRRDELAREIDCWPDDQPGRNAAIQAYAVALGKAGMKKPLRAWIARHEDVLRGDTDSWGMIGHALSAALDDAGTADWLRDWSERDDAQPWMMINLALALRGLDRFDDAHEVSRHTLDNLGDDFTCPFHEVWLILDQALEGNMKPVREYFDANRDKGLDPNHQWIAALARGVLLSRTGKSGAFAMARDHLAEVGAALEPIDRDHAFEIAYLKAIRQIARNAGGLTGRLWRRWRTWKPLLPKRKKPEE